MPRSVDDVLNLSLAAAFGWFAASVLLLLAVVAAAVKIYPNVQHGKPSHAPIGYNILRGVASLIGLVVLAAGGLTYYKWADSLDNSGCSEGRFGEHECPDDIDLLDYP